MKRPDMEENDYVRQRMAELMQPIHQQILMCDDRRDQLMMASAMLIAAKDLFDLHIGESGRRTMFKDMLK
jgi:hypothetical protein